MATMTITTTAPQATRLAKAFGKQLGTMTTDDPPVPRDATAAEIKQATIQFLKQVVYNQERKPLVDAITVPDIDPT